MENELKDLENTDEVVLNESEEAAKEMTKATHYTDDDIQVLEGLEAVRKRPGMYIGNTNINGLHHLVWEIVDNAVDEALAGYCNTIHVTVDKGNIVSVEDNGRGMPTGTNAKTGKSTIETIFTVLHAGGKFGGGGYKVSGGLHGVGASVVNALSDFLEVRVKREGTVYYERFENGGHPKGSLEVIGTCDPSLSGTTVTFHPDASIFETTVYEYNTLRKRLQEMAFLNKGIKITLTDKREEEEKHEEFKYDGGIKEYVAMLNSNNSTIQPDIIYVEGSESNVMIEVAAQYNSTYNSQVYSFTNNIHTTEGGTHEEGVKNALTRVLNNYARNQKILKDADENFTGEDVREGLTMIVSCKHPNPQFEGQTKTKLGNSEVKKVANDVFSKGFERFLMENPDQAKAICEKAMGAQRGRIAAKKARELTRRKTDLDVTNFYGKLSDCKSKDPKECEIFLVEGDSAGGSAKKGRDSMTQAILPLRGKILNVEKARIDKALSNEEIRTIITAFGTGIGDDFDLSKLRYDKIVIMADADVDGSHIRVLLLTLFYRFFKPIVEAGHVYAAQPPLFSIKYGKNTIYALDEAELKKKLAEIPGNVKPVIGRMKGLGEMNADELFDTTMDINKRVLRKITVEDAMAADEIFTTLMGEEVEPRRKFIEEHAEYADLDI